MADVWGDEWRHQNSTINYPFADGATLTNGNQIIPRAAFVDANLYPRISVPDLYLQRIVVDTNLTLFLRSNSGPNDVAYAVYDLGALKSAINVRHVDNDRIIGVLVCSPISMVEIGAWGKGEYTFSYAQTAFAASAITPIPAGCVTGIQIGDEILVGDVIMVGENGIVLNYEGHPQLNEDGSISIPNDTPVIEVVGDAYFANRYCWDGVHGQLVERNPIKYINGLAPDRYGNITIRIGTNFVENPVFKFERTPDGLKLVSQGTVGTGESCGG